MVPSIMNIARVKSSSDANTIFTDDGTAVINPEAGPMPVTLARFSATLLNDNKVKLDWATSMEIICKNFIIERSFDGKYILSGLRSMAMELLLYFMNTALSMKFLPTPAMLFITG